MYYPPNPLSVNPFRSYDLVCYFQAVVIYVLSTNLMLYIHRKHGQNYCFINSSGVAVWKTEKTVTHGYRQKKMNFDVENR